ncbi:MAG: DEAD/DEAH box helicase [Acidobacteria bacterium]|nr:DEAD/DEAH box helicase [Acidobacteriota bacterium]
MSTADHPAPARDAVFAPGLRVEIRDAEWVIKRADLTSSGTYSLLVTGISELVRGKEARFLAEIDRDIKPLHPEDTELVPDTSPRFTNARLYLESLLRQAPPTDANLWIGHRAAIDVLPYQLDPALQALGQIRHRILLADSVGLGKTIEVGVLLAELIRRGKGKRILVVTTKSMMTQFQEELWSRFTIPLVRLDRAGIDRIRQDVPADANPFHYYDKTIISVDTLKQERDFRVHLEKSYWDIIVIDEAHNVAVRGTRSARAKLAELLGDRSDTMILASATPHDGRPESFASLMNMLDPTAIANPKEYGPKDIEGLFLRRFKKDVQEQLGKAFLERKTNRWPTPASEAEEYAYDLVSRATFASFEKAKKTGQLLFRTVLEKSLFSSPAACRRTIEQRLKKIEGVATPEAERDRDTLRTLADAVDAITPAQFTKYQKLLTLLRNGGDLDWHPEQSGDRLVIFTERVETLKFLREHLEKDLKLKPAQIATLHGQESGDKQLQDIVKEFGRDKEPVRLLIATDIASEGINLHFLAHKLIHFDIPWSLMVFQQRNGRIDRYGQEKQPLVAYIPTESSNPKIRGDQRILELLTIKDEQAQKNIDDPSAFFGVYDPVLEELETGKAIEKSLSVEQFDQQMQQSAKAADLLAILMGTAPPPKGETAPSRKRKTPSLYATDLDYIAAGLASDNRSDFTIDKQRRMVSLTLPRDLERSLKRALPKGALPDDGRLHLTSDTKLVQEEIRKTRNSKERLWPHIHLLWDLHPAVEWMNYKLLVNFDRAQAPVITLKSILDSQELVFLMQGETPNRKGQPVVHRWFGVRFESGKFTGIEPLEPFLERTGFHRTEFANPALLPAVTAAGTLLPEAVAHGRKYMSGCRESINSEMLPKLEAERQKLEALRTAKKQQLEIDFGEGAAGGVRLRLKQARERKIDAIFANWTAYVQDTLTTEDAAFLRVAAVFRGE